MTLQRYIARQILEALTLAVGAIFFLALPGIAVSAVNKLPGASFQVLFKFVPLILAELAPYVLPISYLLAVVAVFGRLAADNEWTALRMAGCSPMRLFVMPLWLAVLLGTGTWWLADNLLPRLKRQQTTFLVDAMRDVVRNLSPGRTELQLGPFFLSSRFRDDNAFIDAYIYIPNSKGPEPYELRAERVELGFRGDEMLVHLYDYQTVIDSKQGMGEEATISVQLDLLVAQSAVEFTHQRYLTGSEIRQRLRRTDLTDRVRLGALLELQDRYGLGVIFLLFLSVGAPTGLIMRRGTQLGALAVAVGYATVYYVMALRLGRELGLRGVMDPLLAAWITPACFLLVGLFLCWKALRE